jgi:hypothetical protein
VVVKSGTQTKGLGGVVVTLTGTNYEGVIVSLTTRTNSQGQYSFTGLLASNASGYTITMTQPAGYTYVGAVAGFTGGTTGTRSITTFLNTNANSTGNIFQEK